MSLLLRFRRPIVVFIHLALVVLSNYLAFWLRFDGETPAKAIALFFQTIPVLVAIRAAAFVPFRLYEGLWRYTSIWDLRNIIGGVATSTLFFYLLVHWAFGQTGYPRSIFIIDSILLIFFLGGIRLTRRIYRELGHVEREKRILIYGAGDAGEMIVRDMMNNPFYEYEAVGFIDDDPTKVGQRIHGVKVLGTREVLAKVMADRKPDTMLVAIPRAGPATVRKVVRSLEPFKVPIKTLPNLRDLLGGRVEVSQIRNLSIEDLLERAPVGLKCDPLRQLIEGKRILVTGAGGSIGSELCRQIVALGPSSLVLLERYENGLYAVASELASKAKDRDCPVHPVIGDVTDASRINAVMAEYRPVIVFHAAAHKHVPLMEVSPCEAIKNNVLGTRTVAEAATRLAVERFILVSTDKAVNPTSVMGVTKRVAELLIQTMNHNGHGVFAAVRFGNVLGSNGSVVPRFLEQIKAGGPVTVTHPDMRRYFMLIPEAVQLVLHAAALARGREIFVLEMGEQIKVLDMARNLTRLAGFVPDEEIPITFVGLRPGEKLFEELVGKDETLEPSGVEQILQVRPGWVPEPAIFDQQVRELESLAAKNDAEGVIEQLCEMVPTYTPYGTQASASKR
ncbi:polysaccharide biosynthesis protein [Nitrospiraceae bacterium AH_259_D15_M11_P09]|nr:polysaccharide biosynthesis protein [Nitrospiraceae bacterium AH_259_D15_M11_P09]